jgi:DNA-directed RNA polymerase specialized sigma24 family protein
MLYRRYLPLVVRWSLRKTRNREVAADLTSEVLHAVTDHITERGVWPE